ncbi:AI-2E family transporter [Telluribacter humicola]
MLFLPVSRKLEDWGLSRLLATIACLLILVLIITGFVWVIASEITRISQDMDEMWPRLQQVIDQVQQWINQEFGISPWKQTKFVDDQSEKLADSSNSMVKVFLNGVLGMISSIVLVLIYMLFLIWQRDKYKRFFLKISSHESKPEAKDTIREITQVSSKYLGGRLVSMLFLAIFYGVGFSAIGLRNAILMSLLAVLPSIVPYIGPFIGSFFPISMALLSGSTDLVIPTILILVAAQAIDNNLIEPFVMGANMNLSPLMIIVAIVTGELIWGVAGMILFIPLFAVIRAICDHIPSLSPLGFLMQDDLSESVWIGKIKDYFKSLKNK